MKMFSPDILLRFCEANNQDTPDCRIYYLIYHYARNIWKKV
jgi:hypothetical protein